MRESLNFGLESPQNGAYQAQESILQQRGRQDDESNMGSEGLAY